MKFALALLLIFFSFYSVNLKAEQASVITLNIAKPEQAYPPYHWLENGEVKGLLPDIIAATTRLMGNVEVNYVVMPWKRMFELANKGDIDAIMPINKNSERQNYLNFVEQPLIMERMNFVSTTAFNIEFSGDLSTLSNYDVAGIAGYYYGEAYSSSNLNTIELPNEETQVKMLLAGRFPLAILDTNVLPYYINKLGGEKAYKVTILSPPLYEASLHLAFAKKGRYGSQAQPFNEALINLKNTFKYHDIIKTYLTKNTP
ncbi:transporter substrate-binding domain-containing protein [Thalassotalea sp. M1531]|uniref:Transporter substrate-binding domain-containing protein n=1 Tax=Thalassotalea algicola TaxID=2716224 RepID=A0A7Y0LFL1_9GAMM|nr:transporter substrate-binding domain-containing protein [Thalassotalea algicola]NMP33314.1 transporter substrate-binding domain-containing protein [Thalassotalea algicola]